MECWVRRSSESSDQINQDLHSYIKTPTCGTAACLGGWATHIVPELVLEKGNLFNTRTRKYDCHAFAAAFGLPCDIAQRLTDGDAPHTTPSKAAKAVEVVAVDFAKDHGYEIVPA